MKAKEPSQLSDQELLTERSQIKPSPWFDAFFIGFLAGVVLYSVVANSWGFLTLIPLFIIYQFLKKGRRVEALDRELKARNLK